MADEQQGNRPDDLLTPREAEQQVNVKRRAIQNAIKSGRLRSWKGKVPEGGGPRGRVVSLADAVAIWGLQESSGEGSQATEVEEESGSASDATPDAASALRLRDAEHRAELAEARAQAAEARAEAAEARRREAEARLRETEALLREAETRTSATRAEGEREAAELQATIAGLASYAATLKGQLEAWEDAGFFDRLRGMPALPMLPAPPEGARLLIAVDEDSDS